MSKNYQGNHRVMMGLIAATGLLMGTWARATTVVVTADRQAELSTCGCSLDQLGGLARLPSA